jgi:hypothetical protein
MAITTLALGVEHTPPPDPGGGLDDIPASLLSVYRAAAATCPGLPWEVLAAIGFVESHHGQGHVNPTTGDVSPPILGPPLDGRDGRARIADATQPDGWAHALGPMQFLSTTWTSWGRLAPGRPPGTTPDVQNAWDAIYGAAAYLCGAAGRIDDLRAAILRYNHSDAYVTQVLAKAATYAAATASTGDGRLAWPVHGRIASPFGSRFHPILHIVRFHAGIDISATTGTPIHAPASGTVTRAGTEGGCGISITLEHANGLRTRYCHLSQLGVTVGESVVAGETIGLVGSTGLATGPHLHFEVYDHGQLVDPVLYLPSQ